MTCVTQAIRHRWPAASAQIQTIPTVAHRHQIRRRIQGAEISGATLSTGCRPINQLRMARHISQPNRKSGLTQVWVEALPQDLDLGSRNKSTWIHTILQHQS